MSNQKSRHHPPGSVPDPDGELARLRADGLGDERRRVRDLWNKPPPGSAAHQRAEVASAARDLWGAIVISARLDRLVGWLSRKLKR